MQALVWCGKGKVQVERVPDPKILNPHDIIVQITLTAICGSDLHLYDGYIPSMQPGDILGHEFMGRVAEVGSEVHNLRIGDRVVIPFAIACGGCFFCKKQLFSACDNTNPNAWMVENLYGHSCAGMFGYSHAFGGYAGGQAEYVRVPMADVGALKVPEELPDEQVLFLSDIFPTGFQAAEFCDLKGGETVAVWGAGPVGLMALKSAKLLGAAQLISIDSVPERLAMAQRQTGAIPLKFDDADIYERLMDMTGGRGPDACIDAVGMEAHGVTFDAMYDRAKVALNLATDRAHVLRQMIRCCRKAGVLSLPGVYGGAIDKFPLGAAFGKGLTFRMGQTHVQRYMRPLLERIIRKEIDPSDIITHRMNLSQAAQAYDIFHEKRDHCIKVVLRPGA